MEEVKLELDINTLGKLYPLIENIAKEKKLLSEKNIRLAASTMGIDDIEGYAKKNLEPLLKDGLANIMDDKSASKLSKALAKCAMESADVIKDCAGKDMTFNDMRKYLDPIYEKNEKAVLQALTEDAGIEIPEWAKPIMEKYSISAVTVCCFAAAYKIYQNAEEEYELAKEHRIVVEKYCHESIQRMEEEKAEMEELVNTYFTKHLDVFETAFDSMEKAMDLDEYIAANTDLQRFLGKEVQFENEAEFLDLMDSDISLKL